LLVQHAIDGHLIHVPKGQCDARNALPGCVALLRLHAARRLLPSQQLELNGYLAEEPILRVHPSASIRQGFQFLETDPG
jgi:hypothetical protein